MITDHAIIARELQGGVLVNDHGGSMKIMGALVSRLFFS